MIGLNVKVTLALALTIPLTIAWRLGRLFPDKKVNWFLLYDKPQKPHWYFLDSSHYLTMILLAYVGHVVVKEYNPTLRHLTAIYLGFFILRLIEYWIQAGTTPIWQTLGCMLMITIIYYLKLWGSSYLRSKQ